MPVKPRNPLAEGLRKEQNTTRTENMAKTYHSSLSANVDFFALGGALRNRTEDEICVLFNNAFVEDSLTALRVLFYFRDIRGGQGERRTFRTVIQDLAKRHPEIMRKNLPNVPEFGRWDDLFSLVGTPVEDTMWILIAKQMEADLKDSHPSLLGKWMPSENTSSKHKRSLAAICREKLGRSPKVYRKMLSALRLKIRVVEREMCAKQWSQINYENVPSKASLKYRKAFSRNDGERYKQYLEDVKSGKKTIKVATLYPYEILHSIMPYGNSIKEDATAEVLWKALPDYTGGSGENDLVLADVSGSMTGNMIGNTSIPALTISVALAIYFAERNKGAFGNMFITFSESPTVITLKETTLADHCRSIIRANMGYNTDLQAALNLILQIAKENKVSSEEMPKRLFIISDMEWDVAGTIDRTNFEELKRKFSEAGYGLPICVFWNVHSRHDQVPVTADEHGVYMVSGCSPSTFEKVLKSKAQDPLAIMQEIVNSERYQKIII